MRKGRPTVVFQFTVLKTLPFLILFHMVNFNFSSVSVFKSFSGYVLAILADQRTCSLLVGVSSPGWAPL